MSRLEGPIEENSGKALFVRFNNCNSPLFPLCCWMDNVFCRVSRFLYYDFYQNKLRFLVETNDSVQILIRLDRDSFRRIMDKEYNKVTLNVDFCVLGKNSGSLNGRKAWDVIKNEKNRQVDFPFARLIHFTESEIMAQIMDCGRLLPSKKAMSGKDNIEIPFCNLTDIEDISNTFDFFPLDVVEENNCAQVLWKDDDGMEHYCNVYAAKKDLDTKIEFLVDMRLVVPNSVIGHYKNNEHWWEVLMPNTYRIACESISLNKKDDIYEVTEKEVNGYLPVKGFYVARGDDVLSLEAALHDVAIERFFELDE